MSAQSVGSACGKVILLGEHAAVYAQPALALPLKNLRAEVTLERVSDAHEIRAPQLELEMRWTQTAPRHPLVASVLHCLALFPPPESQYYAFQIHSALPMGAGLGSGAAVSTAMLRAVLALNGATMALEQQQQTVHELEKLYHGTPSGIDDHVVVYEKALKFQRHQPPQFLNLEWPLYLYLGHAGPAPSTYEMVAQLRERWLKQRTDYDALFAQVGSCVSRAEQALKNQDWRELGTQLNHNQQLLVEMGVSSPRLNEMVRCARDLGALGAKLTGGGGGGMCLALSLEPLPELERSWTELGTKPTLCLPPTQI